MENNIIGNYNDFLKRYRQENPDPLTDLAQDDSFPARVLFPADLEDQVQFPEPFPSLESVSHSMDPLQIQLTTPLSQVNLFGTFFDESEQPLPDLNAFMPVPKMQALPKLPPTPQYLLKGSQSKQELQGTLFDAEHLDIYRGLTPDSHSKRLLSTPTLKTPTKNDISPVNPAARLKEQQKPLFKGQKTDQDPFYLFLNQVLSQEHDVDEQVKRLIKNLE